MIFPTTKILKKISHFIVFFKLFITIRQTYCLLILYVSTIHDDYNSIWFYCKLLLSAKSQLTYRNPLNVRGWAIVIVWISPFIVSTCLPVAVRETHYFCPLLSIIFVAKTKITIWAESTIGISPFLFFLINV